ncbi:microtubule-associated protein 10 [Parambassis ranga]|uniref:Microtubule-associated protein 10 n=1 Tax=Parambassis ranga TaxID=210632 RepID=A0A6P7JV88_9TELE|nr:microtubule-associated protein 10 [Parambassis ranga]
MSGQQNSDNNETLFSFQLLVEYIQVDKNDKVFDELALAVRLLDFPTLLIYQAQRSSINQSKQNENNMRGVYAFNRGKSCFFKMNLNSLHVHLSDTPLYAMVLDVKEETPKLVGSSLVSLAKAMDRIKQDVTERGLSTPSSHTERGLVAIRNLAGEKIGVISLSYKLLFLGASLLSHITEGVGLRRTSVPRGQRGQVKEKNKCMDSMPVGNEAAYVRSPTSDKSDVNIHNNGTPAEIMFNDETQQDDDAAEHRKKRENIFEEDLSVFCPPHLYYSNSAEERSKTDAGEYKSMHLDSFTFEDSSAEDETDEKEAGGPAPPVMSQKVRVGAKMPHNQETSSVAPNVLRESLQQLPLLNALLVELSQLGGQNPHQSLTVHPNLAWIYGPSSSEVSAGQRKTPQTKLPQKARPRISPRLHTPRHCSTPLIRAPAAKESDAKEEALTERKAASKPHKTKLVVGTTKTFTLRLKKNSPLKAKHRECVELLQKETQAGTVKEKAKSRSISKKSSKRESVSTQSHNLNENIETVIQSVTVDSALQETVTLKQKNQNRKLHSKHDTDLQRVPGQSSFSERDLRFIHIPSVNSDSVPPGKDKNEHHRESDQSASEPDGDRRGIGSTGSSRHSSRMSSLSVSSREGNEEVDYADDFNSLEPSDACSPDPVSSPELSRGKTLKSPVWLDSDSDSESVQKRAPPLPVPVKASSSPQHALRSTHIIRPRTHTSALSFSSEDGDRDRRSLQTLHSRTQVKATSTESSRSSPGRRSVSVKNISPVRRLSAESISSFEPLVAEELEDELGSLDFRNEYQHISQLVASKLPGYTM